MKTISVDVSADFLENLRNDYSKRTVHHKGGCRESFAWKHRDYLNTIQVFLASGETVRVVVLEEGDIATHISSGFMECVKRNGVENVKCRVRKGVPYLFRTDL